MWQILYLQRQCPWMPSIPARRWAERIWLSQPSERQHSQHQPQQFQSLWPQFLWSLTRQFQCLRWFHWCPCCWKSPHTNGRRWSRKSQPLCLSLLHPRPWWTCFLRSNSPWWHTSERTAPGVSANPGGPWPRTLPAIGDLVSGDSLFRLFLWWYLCSSVHSSCCRVDNHRLMHRDQNHPLYLHSRACYLGKSQPFHSGWRCLQFPASTQGTVFFKTRGHLSRLAWPTQRDGLSCLASPRLALRWAAWPSKTNPGPCSRPVATSGCSHRYYNGIVHNAKCINIGFFSVRQAMFLYKNDCLKW